MKMDEATLRLVIFSFVLSMLFPMMAYTFTSFGTLPENYDITLNKDELENAGIILSDGISHNVTFGGVAQEYTVGNQTMRVQWVSRIAPLSDFFSSQKQSYIEKLFGTWLVPERMDVIYDGSSGWIRSWDNTNATVLSHYDTQYNWTKWKCVQNGLVVFVTPLPASNGNLTLSIINGTVGVTVGSTLIEGGDVSMLNFVTWYVSIVTGQAGDWGMPSFLVWVVRIFSFLTILSGYLLGSELIRG
jgi:hypothetical protein